MFVFLRCVVSLSRDSDRCETEIKAIIYILYII